MGVGTWVESGMGFAAPRGVASALRRFAREVLELWPGVLVARSSKDRALAAPLGRLRTAILKESDRLTSISGSHLNTWEALVDEPTLCAGILRMRGGNRFPVHDHPGSLGASIVIAGSIIHSRFDCPAVPGTGATVHLSVLDRRLLKEGEMTLVLPAHGNAHALSALTDSTLFEVTVSQAIPGTRHWYFPLDRRVEEGSRLAAIAVTQGTGNENSPGYQFSEDLPRPEESGEGSRL